MKCTFAKLAFVHHRLWQADGTYRTASLLGPPPLQGVVLAAAVWASVHALGLPAASAGPGPPWAHPHGPNAGQPFVARPVASLPETAPSGELAGLVTGWQARIHPVQINAALDVDVLQKESAKFSIDRPEIDMPQIIAAGPSSGLYVGVETALLAIKAAGAYGVSLRIDRSSFEEANCLMRLGFAGHRLISVYDINLIGTVKRSYDPVLVELEPGLYRLAVAFGCWTGQTMSGAGRLTVLIRHPGEQISRPAGADEILRPAPH